MMFNEEERKILKAKINKDNSPWRGLTTSEDLAFQQMCDKRLAEEYKKDPEYGTKILKILGF